MIETQQNTISDSLVNKIRGLLRLTKSNNQHEAELAMQRAKALCVKYDLDLASIDPNKTKNTEEPIIKGDNVSLGKRMCVCQKWVSNLLQCHFNVKIIYFGNRRYGQHIVFVGRKRDIDIATYLNEFLNREFLELWRQYYVKNKPMVTLEHRGGYIAGLATGLGEKISESQKNTEEETFDQIEYERGNEGMEQVKNIYALAVINHRKKLSEKVDELFPRLRSIKVGSSPHNWNSYNDGRAKGRTININRPLGFSQRNGLTN